MNWHADIASMFLGGAIAISVDITLGLCLMMMRCGRDENR